MKICSILSILVSFTSCFSPTTHRTLSQPHKMTMLDEQALDEKLLRIAKSVKMEIFDLDEVMYGLESKDSRYGLEVVKTDVQLGQDGSLGLVLTEMAGVSGSSIRKPCNVHIFEENCSQICILTFLE